jgi:ketosteroid isomerase-like protein
MKRLLLALLFVFAFALPGSAASAGEEKAVSDAVEYMRKAMISGVKAELYKVGHPNLVYVHSAGRAETKTEFEDWIVAGKSDFTEIVLSDQHIDITDDIAIVRHIFDGTIADKDKTRTVYLRIMLVFKKIDGEWKLLARQAAKADRPK